MKRRSLFVLVPAALISVFVLGQSSHTPLHIQTNGLPVVHEQPLGTTPNASRNDGNPTFGRRGVRKTTPPTFTANPSGLNFAPAVTYASGGYYALAVAVGDLNGDGKPDLVVANQYSNGVNSGNGSVGVLLGNGDGTFQSAVTYGSGGYNALSVAVADVNGDGKPDLLVANWRGSSTNDGTVGVLLGNGDGTFQTAVSYDSGGAFAESVAIADVNGDGKPDLLVANLCDTNAAICSNTGLVGVLLGNGDGTFQPAVTYDSGGYYANSVAVADVNGDGKPDLLVANAYADSSETSSMVSVLLGNGDGTFQSAVNYGSGGYDALRAAVADVNGDGKPDLLVANFCTSSSDCSSGAVGVLLGNGDGTFQMAVPYGSNGAFSVAVADVDGDGRLDLVAADGVNSGDAVGVLLGNGDGTFLPSISFPSGGWNSYTVAIADVNGDGKPDLLVSNSCVINFSDCNEGGLAVVLINTTTTATTTALVSSSNPSNFGQAVTFTAAVTVQPGFSKGTPTGTMTFYEGATNIGVSNLSGTGVATLTTTALALGTDSITAGYSGDSNFAGSTSAAISQSVQGSAITLSPASVTFPAQYVGTSSLPQSVTLTNNGATTVTLVSVTTTPADFAPLSSCGNSVAPAASCSIGVFFDPTTSGTRNGTLTVVDGASAAPQTVSLSGTGQDFSMTSSGASSATVSPGQTANYAITIAPGGGFNQSVGLSCSGAPAQSTCLLSTSSVNLNGSSSTTVKVAVATAGNSASLKNPFDMPPSSRTRLAFISLFFSLPGLVVAGLWGGSRRRRLAMYGLALFFLLPIAVNLSACGGSGSTTGGGGTGGTPAGNYTISVTGTFTSNATSLNHTTKLTLVVQ